MFRQLLRVPLVRFSSTQIFKIDEKLSWKCHPLICRSLTRGTQYHVIKRNYVTPATKRSIINSPMTWASLGLFLVAGGCCIMYVKHIKDEKQKAKEKELRRSVGMAALGGPFELVDTEGKTVTNESFLGKWLLIYFGFCHCPDICPDQLEKMTSVIEKVDAVEALPKLQPLYITVDPRRDTAELIKEYIKDFHPRMMGLTGTEEQVKTVCKAYRVYYSAGPRDDDDDYIVDHTVIMYLVDPEGKFSEYFGQNKTINEIVGSICTKMTLKLKKAS